jgi:hypothetical protein
MSCKFFLKIIVSLVLAVPAESYAQEPAKQAAGKTLEKANNTATKINEASKQAATDAQRISENVQGIVQNAKTIIKIFEPIVRLRLRKKHKPVLSPATVDPTQPNQDSNASDTLPASLSPNEGEYAEVTTEDLNDGIPVEPQSTAYNPDGTANLGNQNHPEFGCYLDIHQGAVLDEIDAAGQSQNIDLIFTATDYFGSAPMYALLSPSSAKHDAFAYHYFKGNKYKDRNIPPAQWEEVNESEIAPAPISAQQFGKIQDNNHLMAVVKQCGGFKDRFESRTKLDGKVFAIKTEMGNRLAYGLMLVVQQFGTTGPGGYLQIKLKVTGFDADGDGIPDSRLYSR